MPDFLRGEAALIIRDYDADRLSCRLVQHRHVQDDVRHDGERGLGLRRVAQREINDQELKFAKDVFILSSVCSSSKIWTSMPGSLWVYVKTLHIFGAVELHWVSRVRTLSTVSMMQQNHQWSPIRRA
jgi:hypothetical protein